MKSILISMFLLLCCLASTLQAQEIASSASNSTNSPVVVWDNNNINLGTVKQNEEVKVEFTFSNVGNVPLIVNTVKPSCGCTIANYSKEPIQPGESSKITAVYKASSVGNFSKTITVKTNAKEETMVLKFSGIVN